MAKLTEVRLSANPNATTAANAAGINGKVNLSTGGLPYVQLLIEDKEFGTSKRDLRTYWGQKDGTFRGFTPAEMKAQFEGKELKDSEGVAFGKFVQKTVMPYTIKGSDGVERSVSTKTLYIFRHENENNVFTAAGYSVTSVDSEGTVSIIAEPKVRKAENEGVGA